MTNGILIGGDEAGQVGLDPRFANRHGLIAGATGTGKTVTLQCLAEGFSDLGVPSPVRRVLVRPPRSRMGRVTAAERAEALANDRNQRRYAQAVDPRGAALISVVARPQAL
jgi:hypothetical protein